MTHIADDLVRWGVETPSAAFLIELDGTVRTYADVLGQARSVATALRRRGLRPGDRVLLLLPNGVDYLAAYYGTLLAGGTVVGLQTRTARRAVEYVASNCEPRLAVVAPDRPSLDLSGIAVPEIVAPRALLEGAGRDEPPAGGEGSIAQIIYTSGTTGQPKGVMLSHAALRANTSGIVEYLELDASDRVGVVLDFVYSYGNSLLQTHCRVGGSLALLGELTFPARALDKLAEFACSGMSGVPSTFALLLSRGRLEGRDLPALRYLTCAGGALPPANLRRLQELLPDVRIYLMYGQTEASARLSYLPPEELGRRPRSIGRGMPGVDLQVLETSGSRVRPGQEGEIAARGANLMSGYWGDAEATREALRGDRLWTGDLATVDDEGFIYITGRRSDLIKTGAYRVHPREIEDAITSMEGVHECVVVGVPDETWGEAVVACFRDGVAPPLSAIRQHLRDLLPEYKWPRAIVEVSEIPRTASGKPKRRELVSLIARSRR